MAARSHDARPAGIAAYFNGMQGVLQWTDIPDPSGDRPVAQRKKLEIPDPRNLVTVMGENNHK